MYRLILIGFVLFIVISISDTASTADNGVAQTPDQTPDNRPPTRPNNDVPDKPIVNAEDLATFIDWSCIAPAYNKSMPAAKLEVYEECRNRVHTTYVSMIKETNITIACEDKTIEFENAVEAFIKCENSYSIKNITLCNEVMQAIIYSVCHPKDFYENSAPFAVADIKDCFNIIRLLFMKKIKKTVGKRHILLAYDKLREDTNITSCPQRATNFKKAITKYKEIQEKYNKLQLNTKVEQAVIDFVCDPKYKDFYEDEPEFEKRSKECHSMFGQTVPLTTTSTPPPNVNNNTDIEDSDIVAYLFRPSEESESSVQHNKKEQYKICLMSSANNLSLFDTLSSLIPPASNTTETPPVRKGSMGPIWMYFLIAVVILALCGVGAFIVIRGRKQKEGLVEFELKPAQDVQEKNDVKY